MAGRNFAPIGSSGEWLRFSSGSRYPYLLWGGTFRSASGEVIDDPDNDINGVSIVAIGKIEKGEIALASFGIIPPVSTLVDTFNKASGQLLAQDTKAPEWSSSFEEPFENFKKLTRQENTGLLVTAHQQSSESLAVSSFGETTPTISAHALVLMGNKFLEQSKVALSPVAGPAGAQPAT